MSKYRELFSYQTLGGMAWASVVIDTETGTPYTAVFQETNMGGGCYTSMHTLGSEITHEQIYLFALKKQENESCAWFEPDKYKHINASNRKDFL